MSAMVAVPRLVDVREQTPEELCPYRHSDAAAWMAGWVTRGRGGERSENPWRQDGTEDGNSGPDGSRALLAPMRPLRAASGTAGGTGTEDGDGQGTEAGGDQAASSGRAWGGEGLEGLAAWMAPAGPGEMSIEARRAALGQAWDEGWLSREAQDW